MKVRIVRLALTAFALALVGRTAVAQTPAIVPIAGMTTRDIPFTSHDGYPMVGRLTLPDTPGPHAVLMLVQNAEAQPIDGEIRPDPAGPRVRVHNLFRENLAPLGIGFFSYQGRGVSSNAGGGPVIDRAVYDTSTLTNKVRDGISAVRTLQKQPGVDASRIVLRGHSEGSLLAAGIAVEIPSEVRGLALTGVIGTTLKGATAFMSSAGIYLQHLGHWDTNRDGRITVQEFEADPKGIRKQMPPGFEFKNWDLNGDGVYSREEAVTLTKPLTDAVLSDNLDGFLPWLTASAVVQVPGTMASWYRDHMAYPAMWDLLSKLSMPVGIFQGEIDANTPAADVRELEAKAKGAGKTNLEFHYFPGLDHGLGTATYFTTGRPSAAFAALFEFVNRLARR
jgi:pimeloyl-ACP methyl ester carboxylesterase